MGATSPAERIARDLAGAPNVPDPTKETPVADTPTAEEMSALQAAIDAAVEAAVAPLNTELTRLREETGNAEVQAAVAAAVEPLQVEIDRLTTRAGAAEARVAELEAEATAFAEALDAAAAEAAADAALAATRDERAAILKDELRWDDKRVEARADVYAKMDDDVWAETLTDFRANAAAAPAGTPPADPAPIAGASIVGGGTPPPADAAAGNPDGTDPRTALVLGGRKRLRTISA